MDTESKLLCLSTSAQDDRCAPTVCGRARVYQPDRARRAGGISWCTLPGGRRMPILKTLFTNVCEYNCDYCEVRADRDIPRTAFRPEELARAFMDLYRRRRVEGLFLSSGVTRRVNTVMDRMIETVEILRRRYGFRGYIHLKILPGADPGHVEAALRLATRASINLEAPNPQRLHRLSGEKDWNALLERMRWIHRLQQADPRRIPGGQITQFVVGPAGESDQEILRTTAWLYRKLNVRRIYYSAFHPIPQTPLEGTPPTPLLREHRLYQADWLLRFYGFTFEELPFDPEGNLPLAADPKMVWALRHPEYFPVEVLRADYETLLRVPGIGPLSARRIVESRRHTPIREAGDLQKIGVRIRAAAPFLTLRGRSLLQSRSPTPIPGQGAAWPPLTLEPIQPGLFPESTLGEEAPRTIPGLESTAGSLGLSEVAQTGILGP